MGSRGREGEEWVGSGGKERSGRGVEGRSGGGGSKGRYIEEWAESKGKERSGRGVGEERSGREVKGGRRMKRLTISKERTIHTDIL